MQVLLSKSSDLIKNVTRTSNCRFRCKCGNQVTTRIANPGYLDSKYSNPILPEPTTLEPHCHMRSDSRTLFN